MAEKGILIDVGFKGDIKEFIDETEKQFKNIDFASMIGLSDAFDNQIKDARKKLEALKNDIDETINGKLPNEPGKQIKALNDSVAILSRTMRDLVKNMPVSQTNKYESQLKDLDSVVNGLSTTCRNAADAISEIQSVSNNNISFVDKHQLRQLEELYKLLERSKDAFDDFAVVKNKHGKKQYSPNDYDEILEDIKSFNKEYSRLINDFKSLQKNTDISGIEKIEKYARIESKLAPAITRLSQLIRTFKERADGSLNELVPSINGQTKKTLQQLENELSDNMDGILKNISKQRAKIYEEYASLGGGDLYKLFDQKQSKNESISIPVVLQKNTEKIKNDLSELINNVQLYSNKHPLEVEIHLISANATRKNRELMKSIQEQLDEGRGLDNEKLRADIQSLIDKTTKQINDSLAFDIKINSDRATQRIKEFKDDTIAILKKISDVPITPSMELTEENRQAFYNSVKKAFDSIVEINILDGEEGQGVTSEISHFKQLRDMINKVTTAVELKTDAFAEEESIVKIAVEDEVDYLEHLYGELIVVEQEVESIINAFKSMSESIKINIDEETLKSIESLANSDIISDLTSIKGNIAKAINENSSTSIEIPKSAKLKLKNDLKELNDDIQQIFDTKGIHNWSDEFLSKLNTIQNKIKSLFGNNNDLISNIFDDWTYSDEIMMQNGKSKEDIRERSGVIDENGIPYGFGAYDKHNSTGMGWPVIRDLKKRGIKPVIGVHSHGSDRIVASSIPQGIDKVGDLGANAQEYFWEGIEKQVTVALNDIEVFLAKEFYQSNKDVGVDFSSKTIQSKIRNKKKEFDSIIKGQLSTYIPGFLEEYGTEINKSNLFTNITESYIKSNLPVRFSESDSSTQTREYIRKLGNTLSSEELFNNYKELAKDPNNSVPNALMRAFHKTIMSNEESLEQINTAGFSKNIKDIIYKQILQYIGKNAASIIENSFNVKEFALGLNGITSADSYRDLNTYAYRQETPRILREALEGTKYLDNYSDFMKVYTHQQFREQNPLGLSSNSLDSIFNSSAPQNFLNTLEKIVEDIKEIKNVTTNGLLENSNLNINLNTDELANFTSEINKLIDELKKLPELFKDAFKFKTPSDEIANIDAQISELEDKIKSLNNNDESKQEINSLKKRLIELGRTRWDELSKNNNENGVSSNTTAQVEAQAEALEHEAKAQKEVNEAKAEEPQKTSSKNIIKNLEEENELIQKSQTEIKDLNDDTITFFDESGKHIYNVNTQLDEILVKIREFAELMENPMAHAGEIGFQFDPLNLYRTDNAFKSLIGNTPGLISGAYLSSDFLDVLDFYHYNGDELDSDMSKNNRHLYAMDISKYPNMLKLTTDQYYDLFSELNIDINSILKNMLLGSDIDSSSIDTIYKKYSLFFEELHYSSKDLLNFIQSEYQYLNSITKGYDSLEQIALLDKKSLSKEDEKYLRSQQFISGYNGINDSMNRLLESVFRTKDVGLDLSSLIGTNGTDAAGAIIPNLNKIVNGIDFGKNEDLFKYFYQLVFKKIALQLSNNNTLYTYGQESLETISDLVLTKLKFDELFPNENELKSNISQLIINQLSNAEAELFKDINSDLIKNTTVNSKYDSVLSQQLEYAAKGNLIDSLRVPNVINAIANSKKNGNNLLAFKDFDKFGNPIYNENIEEFVIELVNKELLKYGKSQKSLSNGDGRKLYGNQSQRSLGRDAQTYSYKERITSAGEDGIRDSRDNERNYEIQELNLYKNSDYLESVKEENISNEEQISLIKEQIRLLQEKKQKLLDEQNATNETVNELKNISSILSRAFNIPSLEELDNQLSSVQSKLNSLNKNDKSGTIALRGQKDALVDFANEYRKYLDMGGTSPLTDDMVLQNSATKVLEKYASSSAKAIEQEGDSAETAGIQIKNAAEMKEEFTRINKELNDSAEKSAKGIDKEDSAAKELDLSDLSNSIEILITACKDSEEATKLLNSLRLAFNAFSNDKSEEKIQKLVDNIQKLPQAFEGLSINDNGFIKSLESILEKGEQLSKLADVLKHTSKQINAAGKAVNSQDGLIKAQGNIANYTDQIIENFDSLIKAQGFDVLTKNIEPTKDGLIKITSLIKDLNDEYRKVTYTTEKGATGSFNILGIIDNPVKDIKAYQKSIVNAIKSPEYMTVNDFLQKNGSYSSGTFAPNSNEWNALVSLMKQFGIEATDVSKIVRNMNGELESFFITLNNGDIKTLGFSSDIILKSQEAIRNSAEEVENLDKQISKLPAKWKQAFSGDTIKINEFNEMLLSINDAFIKLNSLKQSNDPTLDLDQYTSVVNNYENAIKDLSTRLNSAFDVKKAGKTYTDEFLVEINTAKKSMEELLNIVKNPNKLISQEDIQNINKYEEQIRNTMSQIKDDSNIKASTSSINTLYRNLYTELNKNSAMSSELKQRIHEMLNEISGSNGNMSVARVSQLSSAFKELQGNIQKAGKIGRSFIDQLKSGISKRFNDLIVRYFSFQDFLRYFRQIATTFKELDTALIDLRKTTTMTTSELDSFYYSSNKVAQQMGVTTKAIIEQAAAWSRLNIIGPLYSNI